MGTAGDKLKVLVADDSRVYRKLIESSLGQGQYELIFAENGREAISLFADHFPPIVLTDWEMPDVNGIELCEAVRRAQKGYTYIVFLTSNAQKDQVVEGLTSGADDYLTKPFHNGELAARIAVGFRIVRLHREIESKNKLLEGLALTDALTTLPNRRALQQWATLALSTAARNGFPVWVVLVDLDRFKKINDTYGHLAGDQVLIRLAYLLKESVRASDMCARFGGEEFVMILPHIDKDTIFEVVERIRVRLEKEQFVFDGTPLSVTASFGVSCLNGRQAPDFEKLLQIADDALYGAKKGGRNRIEFANFET